MDPENNLILSLGAFAEMTHIFYMSMIKAGATEKEAAEAMKAYVFSFYHEQIEDARRKEREQQDGEEA